MVPLVRTVNHPGPRDFSPAGTVSTAANRSRSSRACRVAPSGTGRTSRRTPPDDRRTDVVPARALTPVRVPGLGAHETGGCCPARPVPKRSARVPLKPATGRPVEQRREAAGAPRRRRASSSRASVSGGDRASRGRGRCRRAARRPSVGTPSEASASSAAVVPPSKVAGRLLPDRREPQQRLGHVVVAGLQRQLDHLGDRRRG